MCIRDSFKDVFTGKETRNFVRATSSQKCIRISGKHNDLENVGVTARHHTFFEMLGNFSFGDYFKEEAIVSAWDLLTKVYALPTDRLVVTVFGGDASQGLDADHEARALWKKVTGFSDERIIDMGMKDNFWQMGEVGPCGPCTEIHFCAGDSVRLDNFGEEPGPDGTGWIEIWNLVFMQYERSLVEGAYKLQSLPKPCVDTGAGLERMASVLQGKSSNYDTDLLGALVHKGAQLSGKRYLASGADDDVSMRVNRGEIVGFLGPNGSGKTTTIRMMCGLLTLDAGEGRVLGFDLATETAAIKAEVGYMTQRFSLYEDLSIEENLRLVAGLYALPRPRETVAATLGGLGLTSRRRQLAGALSGGWKQRLALAACVMHGPKLLLLDEPTAGVDPKARREFWDEIHRLAAGGMTVLVLSLIHISEPTRPY